MTYPTPYDPAVNFASEEAASTAGRSTVRTAALDAELTTISARVTQIISCITAITRSDAALLDGVVTIASLSTAVSAYLTAAGGAIKGAWLTATAYAVKDVVTNGTGTYICAVAHTSGTFATDLSAARWVLLYNSANFAASGVTFTPAGGIASSNVQAAIEEVDSEKLAKAANLSDVASRAGAFTNLVAPGGTMTGALTFSGARLNEAQGSDIASGATINLDTATGNLVDVTGTTDITGITLSQGREAVVRFTGVLTLTHSASLVLPGSANITTAAGDFAVFRGYAAGLVRCVTYSRASGQPVVSPAITAAVRSIYGLTYSNNGSDITNDIDIAAGGAVDATGVYMLTLSSALTKRSDATFTAGTGNGMLDTGAIGNNDYWLWLIGNSSTGATDVLCSLSSTAPTMPSGFNFRRLFGWFRRSGGAIVTFVTDELSGGGLRYLLSAPVQDLSASSYGAAAVSQTLASLPTGLRVKAMLNVGVVSTAGSNENVLISDLSVADAAPSSTVAPGITVKGHVSTGYGYGDVEVMTNTSRQIRVRLSTGGATETIKINTKGFEWSRR